MKFLRAISTAALVLLYGAIGAAYAQHEQEKQPEKQQTKPEQAARPSAQQPRQQPAQHAQQQRQPSQQPKQPQARQAKPQQPKQQQAHEAKPQTPKQQQAHQAKPQPPKQQAQHTQPRPQGHPAQQQARLAAPPQQGHPTQPQATAWQQQKGWLKQGGGWQGHATWAQNGDRNWNSDHRTWAQRGGYGGYVIPQNTYNVSFGSQHWFRMGGMPSMYMGYPRFSYGGFWFMLVDPWPGTWVANWYADDDVYIVYNDGYYLCNRTYPGVMLAITVSL
jgi:DNA mismatch repair ATPase MutL